MSIVDAAQSEKSVREIKRALEDIGCPVCDADTITDIPDIIRKKCHHGPQHVFNAVIEGGPGIQARLINGKGYKISANDKAELTADLNQELVAGTSIGKALFTIVNKLIPAAAKYGAGAPYIVDVEFVKSSYAGDDSYYNRYFGERGRGRRTGLRPSEWYLKIYVVSQIEPIYTCMGEVITDVQNELMKEMHKMCDQMITRALKEFAHLHGYDFIEQPNCRKPIVVDSGYKHPRPSLSEADIFEIWKTMSPHHHDHHRPDCRPMPPHHGDPCGKPGKPGFEPNKPNKPNRPGRPCPPDAQFPEDLDPGFSYTPDVQFPEDLDPGFGVMPEGPNVQFPENLDPGFAYKDPNIEYGDGGDDESFGGFDDDPGFNGKSANNENDDFFKFLNTL